MSSCLDRLGFLSRPRDHEIVCPSYRVPFFLSRVVFSSGTLFPMVPFVEGLGFLSNRPWSSSLGWWSSPCLRYEPECSSLTLGEGDRHQRHESECLSFHSVENGKTFDDVRVGYVIGLQTDIPRHVPLIRGDRRIGDTGPNTFQS